MNQAVVEAFRGGGLTAADYAGMTPEQMQMVHGAGMQNAQMALGIMQNQQEQQYRQEQAQFQREQFEFQKQVEHQRMELAKRADVRAEVDIMTNQMFKAADYKLRQQELDLSRRLTTAQLGKLGAETIALKDQLEITKARREAMQAVGTEVVQIPGFPPMTMATASALLGEEKVVDILVKMDVAKQANPSAEMQKLNLLRDYAMKRVGMDELNATRFAWVASQTDQGKMSSQEVLDILMKDRLFSLKEPDEQSAIVAEFMRIQNEHSLDLDKLLESYQQNQ